MALASLPAADLSNTRGFFKTAPRTRRQRFGIVTPHGRAKRLATVKIGKMAVCMLLIP